MTHVKILALILAGGAGGRMEELTEVRAKPAMPFAGVYRLIDFPLSNCVHSMLSDVWVVEQFQPHTLNEHLANGRPWDLDRTYGGLRILPPHTGTDAGGWHQGNADAIYRNRHFIREFGPDLLLVLSADHIYKLDYRQVIDAHLQREAEVTIVTTEVARQRASRHGNLRVDGQGRVTEFAYKPKQPLGETVTTEVFVYDTNRLLETLEELAARQDGQGKDQDDQQTGLKDFGHELLPAMVQAGRAYAFALKGYWRDVGTIASYWQSHMDLLKPVPPLDLDEPGWPILTYGVQRLPARVEATARIEGSLISSGCVVRGHVINSVLGPGVVVEEGAQVRDSIVLQNTMIETGAQVINAIIDTDARIGARAQIGRDVEVAGDAEEHKRPIAVVGMRAQISAGAMVPVDGRVKPGATF